MTDYRDTFYTRLHGSTHSENTLDEAHYKACSRQLKNRWGRWLPPNKESVILDLGCGTGECLFFLRSLGYKNVSGVDSSAGALQQARQIGLENLTCDNACRYLENKKGAFDLICAFNLFEHLQKEELLRLLELIFQALKPGGKALAVTPNGLSPFSGATRYWDFSHETSFTPASWRQIAHISGFDEIRLEEYGPMPRSFFGLVRVLLWQWVRLSLDFVSLVEIGGFRDVSRVYTADMKVILIKPAKIQPTERSG